MSFRYLLVAGAVVAVTFLACSARAESIGARFGARDPRTCPDHSAPREGAITAPLATAYVMCDQEQEYNHQLYLIGGIDVQVGRGRPYQRSDEYQSEIDPDQLVYPIRGKLVAYQCDQISANFPNTGKNCTATSQPNATGECYRTTFGDWRCRLSDTANLTNVVGRELPPPQ